MYYWIKIYEETLSGYLRCQRSGGHLTSNSSSKIMCINIELVHSSGKALY
uniref:Uncharacterized protein n=1 Tax=Anguilla anguilla TaxID=7936 RepID=A0A0E9U147_ANGAN